MLLFYVLLLIKMGFWWKSWHELSNFKIKIKQKHSYVSYSNFPSARVGECQVMDNHTQILPAYRTHHDTGVAPHPHLER